MKRQGRATDAHATLPNAIDATKPAVILAPMEGVTDAPMRALLTSVGGFSLCVSEFFRVSQDAPAPRAFRKHVPEIELGSITPATTPVQLQLLGGDPEKLAISAQNALKAGATAGIDLNFGCPAPTVNRHDGGATLLLYPDRIESIVRAVRQALPSEIPVSAKIRLGWDEMRDVHRNAEAAARGGASWLTIHARTKTQGYRPPAYWEHVGDVRRALGIPVVANGEIWTIEDFKRCRDVTGCNRFMIGRGALADPWLGLKISQELGLNDRVKASSPPNWAPLVKRFAELSNPVGRTPNYALCRIKQWMRILARRDARPYELIKSCLSLSEALSVLETAFIDTKAAVVDDANA